MAEFNPKLKEIREFIYVAQPPDRPVYAVKTIYQETDAINAGRQLAISWRSQVELCDAKPH